MIDHTYELTESIRQSFGSCMEVLDARAVAEIVQRYETDNDVQFTDAQVLKATREAGEQFVDDYVSNEQESIDYLNKQLTSVVGEDARALLYERITEHTDRQEYFEAMRPSTIRRNHLAALLAPPVKPASAVAVQTAAGIIADPCASYWLKNAIHTAVQRDPLDAVRDAETLALLLAARLA